MREGAGVSELGTQEDSGVKRENAIMDAGKGNEQREGVGEVRGKVIGMVQGKGV